MGEMPRIQRPSDGALVPDGWSRSQLAALSGIAVVTVLLGWLLRQPDVMAGGDDITYWLLGKSLAAGHYHDAFSPGTPPHVKYPPGMPLWLAAVNATGLGLSAVQLGQLVMLVVTALLVADALRRLQAPWLGVVAAAGVALNPTLLQLAGTMLSETLYTLFATVTLWGLLLLDRSTNARHRNTMIAVATLAAMCAFLTRSVGLAVLATVPAVLLMRRHWWGAGLTALVGAVTVAGWYSYVAHATQPLVASYAADLAMLPLDATHGGMPGRVLENIKFYIVVALPVVLGLPGIEGNSLDNLVWTLVVGGGALLGAIRCYSLWSAAPISVAFCGVLLLAWPWGLDRLAAPLVPVGIALMLLGAGWPLSRGLRPAPRVLPLIAVVMVIGVGMLFGNVRRAGAIAQCSRVDSWGVPSPCAPHRQQAMVATARAARSALPEHSVIATSKDAVVYYHSGYQTIPLEHLDYTLPSVVAAMKAASATHLLVSRNNPGEERDTGPRVLASCAELTEAIPSDGPAVLLAPRQDGDPDACAGLRRVVEWQDTVE